MDLKVEASYSLLSLTPNRLKAGVGVSAKTKIGIGPFSSSVEVLTYLPSSQLGPSSIKSHESASD